MIEKIDALHYRLHGTLNIQESAGVLKELFGFLSSTGASKDSAPLKLDVSGLASPDSVLLAAILEVSRQSARMGCSLQVMGLSDNLTGLARVYGIDSLIEAHR
jgi:ABC-type transporter Mla MlaB component